MSHKKEPIQHLSEDENAQVQRLFASYHQIADNLHQSTDQAQVEGALFAINELSEQAQIALLKALAKEINTDAADVLIAVNVVGTQKEVRKEARRSLIRLEGSKTYPQWTPPIERTPVVQVNVEHAPRFWKGFVTQAREEGEIQLILTWEQGYDYSDARLLVILLDYWSDGAKDMFVELDSKHHVEERINEMRTKFPVPLVDCTLAEGKRLLEEALSVNTWRGTTPHKDYRNRQQLINSLILEASDLGRDRGRTFINPELTEAEVALTFIGGWSMGDYGLAYDLLIDGSSVREGLSRDEWVEHRRAWSDEADPTRMELGFVHEREQSQSAIWLPTSVTASRQGSRKEIELGWSLELTETPLSGTLREMPLGTAVNKETGRHWFWTSYTLVQEQGAWRIQSMSDEGVNVQSLSINELQKRIKEYEDAIQEALKKRNTDPQGALEEIAWRITQLLHFYDALIVHLPLDYTVCEDVYSRSVGAGNPERSLVYLERLAQRFPEHRVETLRTLGATQLTQAYNDSHRGLEARAEEFTILSEKNLREAATIDDSATSHLLLSELLLSLGRDDEAEVEFRRASSLSPTREEEAALEAGLGNLEMRREHLEEALSHYQQVTNLDPDYTGIWFNLGFAQRQLQHFDEALEAYRRAIQQEPEDIRPYSEMTAIYMNRGDKRQAGIIVEQGVRANPDSPHLHALFASVLSEQGDQRAAQRELAEAEAIDPDLEIVARVREQLQAAKKNSRSHS
ncbi:MAG: tetratricopeptide repeat protein [Ktedonobacteraceae bacterium]|nr:tetratricopeptide repeat protein [Ktedonobacteraceae bacterium]